jgi:hypothetical protein
VSGFDGLMGLGIFCPPSCIQGVWLTLINSFVYVAGVIGGVFNTPKSYKD